MGLDQYVDSLTDLLHEKGTIAVRSHGRLECRIAPMINLEETTKGYRMAADVLTAMEDKGYAVIRRHDLVMKSVKLSARIINQKEASELTNSNESKATMQEAVETSVDSAETELTPLELANKALRAVQEAADSDDAVRGSLIPIIEKRVKVSKKQAAKLSALLEQLGLRQLLTRGRRPVYLIDMKVTKITQDMLDKLKVPAVTESAASVPEVTTPEATADTAVESVMADQGDDVVLAGVVVGHAEDVQPVDEAERIAIMDDGRPPIERLADLLIESRELNDRLTGECGRLTGQCDRLDEELRTAKETIRLLNEKVQKLETLSPRVMQLLQPRLTSS